MQSSKSNQSNVGPSSFHACSLCSVRLVIVVAGFLAPMCVDAQSPAELMANADQLGDRSGWQ